MKVTDSQGRLLPLARSQSPQLLSARFRASSLYRYGLKFLLGIRFTVGLFARLERQWFGKPNRNPAKELIYVINPADATIAGKTCHIKAVSGAESRDAKASR